MRLERAARGEPMADRTLHIYRCEATSLVGRGTRGSQVAYLLLTGSTGLVGRYLLRNLLQAEVPVAALVRGGTLSPAAHRMEAVMNHWEQQAGHALPRPVVLEGELTEPQLGLAAGPRRWVARHVGSVLHCAASMTFREDRRGEPFRTNVEGTRNLLELCRQAGIRQFHHVSTAYLCGLREGRVLETEVDLGQSLGNVYEQSKLQAEKLIRSADFLERATFYRPASVVGDSRSGYVTSYHGFYLPLQLAYSISGQVPVREMNDRFFSRLGLRGDEGKNLVPVDWLADAITYLVMHPEHHGRTYHLASPQPVQVRQIQRVIQDALDRFSTRPQAQSATEEELQVYEQLFQDYMGVYRSHWRDDPKFDLTHTRQALPHLPCPDMTYELLMRVARYPIERKFQNRRHEQVSTDYDVEGHMQRLIESPLSETSQVGAGERLGLQVNGRGGGQWQLLLRQGELAAAEWGLPQDAAARYYLNTRTFRDLVGQELTVEQSIRSGRVLVEGGRQNPESLVRVLQQLVAMT